ncbi:MAG: GntR family transcriptional regulator [Tissierellia bacterium]|nr:GntR family transcriptional regulator [Tissierellia bacterium]
MVLNYRLKGKIYSMVHLTQIDTKGTLTEKTYEILKKNIIELKIKPGKLLVVDEISEQLGVSRTPIKAALNSLINDGLIEMIQGKGAFVKALTKKEASNIINVRELLECYSVKLAAELRIDDDIKELEYMIYKSEFAYKIKNYQDFLTLDSEFHYILARISNNPFLLKQITQILNNNRRYLNATTDENIAPYALEEHRAIIEQIKKRDIYKSEEYMQKHIGNVKKRVIEYIVFNEENSSII